MIREATEEERTRFRRWHVGRDDIKWTKLHSTPFTLLVTDEKLDCTYMHFSNETYVVESRSDTIKELFSVH